MRKSTIILNAFFLCILTSMNVQAQLDIQSEAKDSEGTVRIIPTNLEVSDNILKLSYQIGNHSDEDIWICEDIAVFQDEFDFEAYLAEDNQTLVIRRRLDVLEEGSSLYAPTHGRYVRLRMGQIRTESLLLPLPVYPRRVFFWGGSRPKGTVNAKRIRLEIGYCAGNMPHKIFKILEETETAVDGRKVSEPVSQPTVKDWFAGMWHFNEMSEHLRDRNEEFVIPWTNLALKIEQVLRIVVDDQQIPYEERYDESVASPPDLTGCTRVELKYQPSILEYFFPYADEQGLMSPTEIERLQSQETAVMEGQKNLKTFAEEISKGFYGRGGIVTQRSTAVVVCYQGDNRIASFIIFDDLSIITEDKKLFRYKIGLPSLMELTPQIRPFKLRISCVGNLRDLWYRLHLNNRAENRGFLVSTERSQKGYPDSAAWCDVMIDAYRANIGKSRQQLMMKPYKCPAAGEGKSHYAMNPNCKSDSPPETVLLFETKAGWNQHGGPELFSFDNHDPKGGCVLLNDGTVKFIRTKEELQQLRWK